MIIQCPACRTQAQLPESKEGAKVRCSECSRVYVARPLGATRGKKFDPTKLVMVVGGAAVFLLIYLMVKQAPDKEYTVTEDEGPERAIVHDYTGWDSPLVVRTRDLHRLALAADRAALVPLLDGEYAWRRRHEGFGGPAPTGKPDWVEEEEGQAEVVVADTGAGLWIEQPTAAKSAFLEELAGELVDGAARELVADWEPFNGWVEEETDDEAVVRLQVSHRTDFELENRHVEWRFVLRRGEWQAWYWERWYSEDEIAAYRRARKKKTVMRTLSDGSVVIEGDVRPIEFTDDTPADVRQRVQKLCADLIDLDAKPGIRTEANRGLVEIGKPAIPALMSMLAEIPLETEEQAIQLNLVHLALTDITGYVTTFKVHELLGATRERQESGLKQWFGWYDRKYKRFTAREESEDPLIDLFEPRSEKERLEFEKYKKEQGGG